MTKETEAKARLAKEQKRRERLLRELKQRKYSCRREDLEAALIAWKFEKGDRKGQSQVWEYKDVLVTVHPPHGKSGGNNADPGAVAKVIQKIDEARVLQEQEAKKEASKDVN